jgi:hypothetical protein
MHLSKALTELLCLASPLVVWLTRDTMPSGYATFTDGYLVGVSVVNIVLLAVSHLVQHPNTNWLRLLNVVSVLSAVFCLAATSYDECLDVSTARVDLLFATHLANTLRGEVASYVLPAIFILITCLELILLWQYVALWARRRKPQSSSTGVI